MLLYHGTNTRFEKPRIIAPNRALDFGMGFYTTAPVALKLFRESPLVIFDMYKKEIETGNPRESSYIKGDAYV
jgi:hypothetical protein